MKKILFALVALSAIAIHFTSCEPLADPEKYAVSGHTFVYENDTMKTTLEFFENWYAELESTINYNTLPAQPYRWSMSGNNVQLKTVASTTYTLKDGTKKTFGAGTVMLEGPYDAVKRTLYLTSPTLGGEPLLMNQKD